MKEAYKEDFNLWCVPEFHGLEFLKATYMTHVFPRHWNETYVIQVVERGVNELYCRGATHVAPAGSLVLINPHEIHTGCSIGKVPLRYRTFYPAPELLAEVASQLVDRNVEIPFFPSPIVSDARLASMIQNTHRACEAGVDPLVSQTLVLEAFSLLIMRHSDQDAPLHALGKELAAVKRAKEYLTGNFNTKISLETLAKIAYLSPFHLLRAFRKTVGLPPHEYLINLRIERAKQLLAQGRALAEVAHETGFCDQSHFNRHFKRIIGLPPGQYLKKSNFVQNF
jgi:AraC-like DNA-binding protein